MKDVCRHNNHIHCRTLKENKLKKGIKITVTIKSY